MVCAIRDCSICLAGAVSSAALLTSSNPRIASTVLLAASLLCFVQVHLAYETVFGTSQAAKRLSQFDEQVRHLLCLFIPCLRFLACLALGNALLRALAAICRALAALCCLLASLLLPACFAALCVRDSRVEPAV
jgi:hypothetical protein